MEEFENIKNWDIIKDTDALVSTNEGISSFFVDSNLNGDFTEVTYEIDRSETISVQHFFPAPVRKCHWSLITTFQNEANTPLIAKIAREFFL